MNRFPLMSKKNSLKLINLTKTSIRILIALGPCHMDLPVLFLEVTMSQALFRLSEN